MEIKDKLIQKQSKGEQIDFLFFWGHISRENKLGKECLSQWYDCKFTQKNDNGEIVEYHTAEQFMMAQKALLFEDLIVYNQIMCADEPREYKELGREVSGFDKEVWDKHKTQIVLNGNILKFSQNEELLKFLKGTNNAVLVEASPYDRIWGIGMRESNPNAKIVQNWKGENLLGFILMQVRERLKNGN